MSVQSALATYLKTVGAITALVGTTPARIRAFERKQGEILPAITYFVVDSQIDASWQGISGLTRSRIQIDCWSDEHAESLTLFAAIRAATDGFKGVFGSDTVRGCRIAGTFETLERPTTREGQLDQAWIRQSIDWMVWHE